MWYARDIKSKIITQMNSTTVGINIQLTSINSERTESTPTPLQLNTEADTGQYPVVFVDLGDSQVVNSVGAGIETMAETFELEITAILKGAVITTLKNDCENYIEAILRNLEGWKEQANDGSYICQANSIMRADIDTDKDQTVRAVMVRFTVMSNQI